MRPSLALFALLVGGCSSDSSHAPHVSNDCTAPPCAVGYHPGGMTGGGTPDGGVTVTVDGGVQSVTGSVNVFSNPTLLQALSFTGSGTVFAFGDAGPSSALQATFSSSTFTIDAPAATESRWFRVVPTSTPDLMTTLSPTAPTQRVVSLDMLRVSDLTQVFDGLVQNPQSQRSGTAHLFVRFVDALGAPLTGVQITKAPGGSVVAYDSGNLYSDAASPAQTQGRGVAVMLNATAVAWPAKVVTITFRYGTPAVLGSLDAYLEADAVTVMTVAAQ